MRKTPQSRYLPSWLGLLWGLIVIDLRVVDFFQYWREHYRWPLYRSRKESEQRIRLIVTNAQAGLASGRVENLETGLLQIHRWKTRNHAGITDKYAKEISKDRGRLRELLKLLPVPAEWSPEAMKKILNCLRVKYSNLPVCTTQLSFLSGRQFPLIDRYIAQFMSRKVHPQILKWAEFDIAGVFETLGVFDFRIEDDWRNEGIPMLAVFTKEDYRHNRDLYLTHYVPKLIQLAKQLQEEKATFRGIDQKEYLFSAVDLQMAVFTFAKQNPHLFKKFYRGRRVPSLPGL